MALISRIPVAEVAAVVARALEELLGHDVVLTTGAPESGDPSDDVLPEGATRAVVLPFSDGVVGEVTLVVGEVFATAMEAATPDASLTTAALPALEAGAAAIALTVSIGVNTTHAGEISTETLLTTVFGDFAAVAVCEDDRRVACVVVRIVDEEPVALAPVAPGSFTTGAEPYDTTEDDSGTFVAEAVPHAVTAEPPYVAPPVPAAPSAPPMPAAPDNPLLPAASPGPAVAVHEFQPLADGAGATGPVRPLALLNDVNMQVTAELGRRRMKVRDIVSLRVGSVVELDRAAGSPVDVLVNGALVWHGEVVVVDEEFGIRVSEIVVDEN